MEWMVSRRDAGGKLQLCSWMSGSYIATNGMVTSGDHARERKRVMAGFRKSSATSHEFFEGRHRFEHWYRDNSVYFITSKVRDGFHAFESESAKAIFWDRFQHYTVMHGFVPWVTTLMINHYHTLGYLRKGEGLGEMMRKIHGSVAWLVMKDIQVRHVPFWRHKGNKDYFDGCIRDVLQAERAYRYTLMQAVRAGMVADWREYPHTRVNVEIERAIQRAVELKAFMEGVPFAWYERRKKRGHQR
jgi:hypothetical protein